MKTKVLIALLQAEDPTGEEEVVMDDGRDIFFLESLPGYWDGCYTTLIRDESKKPYYDIVGAKYRSDGSKIKIKGMGWDDVIADNVDAPVEVTDCSVNKWMQKEVDDCRREMKEIGDLIEKEMKDTNIIYFDLDDNQEEVCVKKENKMLLYIFSMKCFFY